MKGLTKLHHLIHSLSKTEKRYIFIELSKQKSLKGKIDLKLFNLLKKQETLDEDTVLAVSEFNTTQKIVIRSNYLFDFILRCLIDYNYSREIEIAIGNHIRIIKNFILKGLHQYTHFYFKKAQKLAEKYEDLYRIGILCTLKKIVINQSSASHTDFFREIQKIEEQETLVHEKIINLNAYNNHLNHLTAALKKNSSSHLDKETLTILKDIITSPLFSKEKNALTKKAKVVFHQIHAIYHEHATHDYMQALQHTEKQIELIKNLESYQKADSPLYITSLKNYCIYAAESHEFDKANETLRDLKNMYEEKSSSQNLFEKSLVFKNYIEAETRLSIIDSEVQRFASTQSDIESGIDSFGNMFDSESKMVLYSMVAMRLIVIHEYKKAFRWLEKIFHEHQGMRLDILHHAHILSLICIFEIESVNLFQSRVRSYLRHYQQEKNMFPLQVKIIHSLSAIFQHSNDIAFQKTHLKELKTFILQAGKEREIDMLLSEVLLAWINAKLNRPISGFRQNISPKS